MIRNFTHILMVFALVFASVSPACAFVSGKNTSVIEICSEFGVKKIVVDENGKPVQDGQQKQMKKSDCAFCFAQSHAKTLAAQDFHSIYGSVIREKVAFSAYRSDITYQAHLYIARAPPASFLA